MERREERDWLFAAASSYALFLVARS